MRFLLYIARWQLSALIMMPLMFVLGTYFGLSVVITLPIGQLFGAFVFWEIDKWIFKNEGVRQ